MTQHLCRVQCRKKKNIHPVVKYSYSLYEENHAGVTEDIQDILLTFYFIKT